MKKRTRAPIYERSGAARVIRGKILSVDTVKWTCRVQGEGNELLDGVSIQPTYLNSEGGSQAFMPETNMTVWLCYPSTDAVPFIMGSASLPIQADEGDPNEDPNDHRTNRPVLNEGDMLIASSGTGRIIMRRGGVLEIGASETAKRLYIPLTNLIREFSQNYEHETGGGLLSMKCRDEDETYGPGATPAEFKFQWREFGEDDAPMIDIRMGRIKAEDDQMVVGGARGEAVYRFNINNRHQVWVDKRGNYQSVTFGSTFESYVGPRVTRHDKTLTQIVRGTLRGEYQARHIKVPTTDALIVGRDRSVSIGGRLTETIGTGLVRVVSGPVSEDLGGVERSIKGEKNERILNGASTTVGGVASLSVGQSLQEVIGETSRTMVANAQLAGTAWEVVVANGTASFHNVLGKNVWSTGLTQATPSCKIVQKPTGAILIQSALGAVEVEVNVTGVRIKTAAGEISLDNVGTVLLGPPGRGNVVTTTTFPADLTTGVPILGVSSVQAGGIPAPGPAALPSTFIPDLTP